MEKRQQTMVITYKHARHPGGLGQAHVHKLPYPQVGQWKLVNRSVMII